TLTVALFVRERRRLGIPEGGKRRMHRGDARCGYVLGRPVREGNRSVRSSLEFSNAHRRRCARGNGTPREGVDGADGAAEVPGRGPWLISASKLFCQKTCGLVKDGQAQLHIGAIVLCSGRGKGCGLPGIQFLRSNMSLRQSRYLFFACVGLGVFLGVRGELACRGVPPKNRKTNTAPDKEARQSPSGKKLVLKDGNYQLVREYRRNGERVRYLSAERGDWEEIPAAMVDWDATAKAEVAATSSKDELLKKVRHEEEQQRRELPLDVDASLPVAPGIFLPPGEGMFVVEGKSVTPLEQAEAEIRTDKKQLLKKVLSPVPIVPGKRNVQLEGPRAIRRINSERPEFYLRE